MRITWLGQSGYLLDDGKHRLAIDPYYSDIVERKEGLRRLVPPPLPLASLAPDALFVTHNHIDHYDPETVEAIMAQFPACQLIGPASVCRHARQMDLPAQRLTLLAAGATTTFGGIQLTATPARHSDPDAVGLLLRSGDELIWFSGDTLYFPELSAQVRQAAGRAPDLAFICINGRLGNMDLRDAARVMAELRPHLAVPMHYGMFAENTADPAAFRDACAAAGQVVHILAHGATLDTAPLPA